MFLDTFWYHVRRGQEHLWWGISRDNGWWKVSSKIHMHCQKLHPQGCCPQRGVPGQARGDSCPQHSGGCRGHVQDDGQHQPGVLQARRHHLQGAEAGGCQPDQHQQTFPWGGGVPGLGHRLRGQGPGQLPPRGVQERGLCHGLPHHQAPHVCSRSHGEGQGSNTNNIIQIIFYIVR